MTSHKGKAKRLHYTDQMMPTSRQLKKRGHDHFMSRLEESKRKLYRQVARNKSKKYG